MELDWDCFLSHPFHREDLETPALWDTQAVQSPRDFPAMAFPFPDPKAQRGCIRMRRRVEDEGQKWSAESLESPRRIDAVVDNGVAVLTLTFLTAPSSFAPQRTPGLAAGAEVTPGLSEPAAARRRLLLPPPSRQPFIPRPPAGAGSLGLREVGLRKEVTAECATDCYGINNRPVQDYSVRFQCRGLAAFSSSTNWFYLANKLSVITFSPNNLWEKRVP